LDYKQKKLYNENPSDLLICVPVSGKPHERVFYLQHTLLSPLVEQVRYNMLAASQLVIKTDGNLFNFRGAPLQFKLEINQKFSKYTEHEFSQSSVMCF